MGFALSGGGIRSATLCLGLFQALAKCHLLGKVDFLSTVSGGGYFGAFLGRLFTRDGAATSGVQDVDDVEQTLLGRHPTLGDRVFKYLRENGRYLAPNGAGDLLLGGAVALRNWVSIHVVLGVLFLALFLLLQVPRSWIEVAHLGLGGVMSRWLSHPPLPGAQGSLWWSPYVLVPVLLFVFWAFPLGWAYWLVERSPRAHRSWLRKLRARVWPFVPLLLIAGICVGCLLGFGLSEGHLFCWTVIAVCVLTVGFWCLARRRSRQRSDKGDDPPDRQATELQNKIFFDAQTRNRLSAWLKVALVVTGGSLALALVDTLGQTVYLLAIDPGVSFRAWVAGIVSGVLGLGAAARRVAVYFSPEASNGRPRLPIKVLASVAALLLVVLFLVAYSTAAHAIVWWGDLPAGAPTVGAGVRPATAAVGLNLEVEKDTAGAKRVSIVANRERDPQNPMEIAGEPVARSPQHNRRAYIGCAFFLLLALLFSRNWPFVNRSSLHALYSARLARAYLGASNPERHTGKAGITTVISGDDVSLAGYWPTWPGSGASATGTGIWAKGGPLHLINVTVNETFDAQHQIQQQDRKGTGMALGPCGMSLGIRHHVVFTPRAPGDSTESEDKETSGWAVLWVRPMQVLGKLIHSMREVPTKDFEIYPPKNGFRVFEYKNGCFLAERLSLGHWVGISGAAFSTGMGANTSLGLSLLLGMGNVRLGYWWDSGVSPGDRQGRTPRRFSGWLEDWLIRAFPVQSFFLYEFIARFRGTALQRWYVSDGGHFENMGVYELIRRRLGLIVVVDAEADPDYTFNGLANLIRKARLDFHAEIRFLTEEELDRMVDPAVRPCFGTLDQLRRAEVDKLSKAHGALARIYYEDSEKPESTLVYLKPSLIGDEPADLMEYWRAHPKFPQEPTADQFFDEAQWESYRKLGEHIGESLFRPTGRGLPGKWVPRDLEPLTP